MVKAVGSLWLLLVACQGVSKPVEISNDLAPQQRAAAQALVDSLLLPAQAQLQRDASALVTSVQAYCATPNDTTRDAAQAAWRSAMATWQALEMFRAGPLATNASLHDAMYSWPLVSTCAVDQEVMARHQAPEGYTLATKLTNRRGLPALEYLLFAPAQQTCPPQAAPAGWEALSSEAQAQARCGMAEAVARDFGSNAEALVAAGQAYRQTLSAQLASSPAQALNQLSDALFYLDLVAKSQKLGEAVGVVRNSCGPAGTACVAELEAPYARVAKANLLANLKMFERAVKGLAWDDTPSQGLVDLLRAAGAAHVADAWLLEIAKAEAALRALPDELDQALNGSPASVRVAYDALVGVTDILKGDFLLYTKLQVPKEAAGDSD